MGRQTVMNLAIDAQPLREAKPLLSVRDETEYAIETDLTEEEHALIEDSVRRYHDDPSSFVSLSEAKRRMGYE
jgi:hypothetical protein